MGFVKAGILIALLGAFFLSGCSVEQTDGAKLEDLAYSIPEENELPDELKAQIEEKKAADFKLAYESGEYLFIVRGYGEQETGGYSIQIRDFYLTSNAIFCDTDLIGPSKGDTVNPSPSYPYIVLKTKYQDKNVIFE